MECLACGGNVKRDDKFCQYCGHDLMADNLKTMDKEDISPDLTCPSCHEIVDESDKFCTNCGYDLTNTDTQAIPGAYVHNNQQVEITENMNLAYEAKNLFNNTTKSIGRLAGNEEVLNLNLKDMFSEVFKSHAKHESDDIFIAGTRNTTPHIKDVSQEWAKPWVFSRVFLALGITFMVLLILVNTFANTNALPGLIFIGALIVPISGLIFFYESNAFQNISFFEVLKMFFIGGVFSLLSTIILYNFVSFSDELETYGIMTITDAFLIGLVEELGKAIIVILFINYLKTNKILNGLLIGASIGAGFAVFETAGYILNYGILSTGTPDLTEIMDITILRGWSAIGGHLVWASIIGAAAVIVKDARHFTWANILDKRFLFFFFVSVILHCIWDTDITVLGSSNLKMVFLIIIAWIFVFILMKSGLNQVNQIQNDYLEMEGRQR